MMSEDKEEEKVSSEKLSISDGQILLVVMQQGRTFMYFTDIDRGHMKFAVFELSRNC